MNSRCIRSLLNASLGFAQWDCGVESRSEGPTTNREVAKGGEGDYSDRVTPRCQFSVYLWPGKQVQCDGPSAIESAISPNSPISVFTFQLPVSTFWARGRQWLTSRLWHLLRIDRGRNSTESCSTADQNDVNAQMSKRIPLRRRLLDPISVSEAAPGTTLPACADRHKLREFAKKERRGMF